MVTTGSESGGPHAVCLGTQYFSGRYFMKKKTISTVLSAFLCGTLLIGCGSGNAAGTVQSTDGSSAAGIAESVETQASASETAESSSSGELDKSPITLTLGISQAEDGEWDCAVAEQIKEATGITLNIVKVDHDKMKVLAAGGDLPDLFWLPELSMMDVSSIISSGQLLPLDDLLEEYGQDILKNEPTAIQYSKKIVGDGTTYILPCAVKKAEPDNPLQNGFVGFFTRYDYYKAIGSPEMNGEDEYLDVLKQIQDYAQSQRTDGKKVYALSAWTDWGAWPYIIPYPFSHGYTNLNANFLGNCETGEVENEFLEEDGVFWKGMKFFNKAYRMGLFDPEGLTQKWQQYCDKIENGLVLTNYLTRNSPNTVLLPGAFEILPDIYDYDLACGYQVNDSRAISTNCKYPERAMQLLNYLETDEGARLIFNGVQGEDWDYVDGVPQPIGERLKYLNSGDSYEYDSKRGINTLEYFCSGVQQPEDGYPVKLTNTKNYKMEHATPEQQEFAADYGDFKYPGQVYDQWVKDGIGKTCSVVPVSLQIIGPCSEEAQQIQSNGEQYFNSNLSKVVLAESDEQFEKAKQDIISDLKAMGYENAANEFIENAKVAKEEAASFEN